MYFKADFCKWKVLSEVNKILYDNLKLEWATIN